MRGISLVPGRRPASWQAARTALSDAVRACLVSAQMQIEHRKNKYAWAWQYLMAVVPPECGSGARVTRLATPSRRPPGFRRRQAALEPVDNGCRSGKRAVTV